MSPRSKLSPRYQAKRRNRTMFVALMLAAPSVVLLAFYPLPRSNMAPRAGLAVADVQRWGFRLQRATPTTIPSSVDLLVVDYSADGATHHAAVAAFKARVRQPPRIVLAYLSIGEAEADRPYWSALWSVLPPTWLGPENEAWGSNYRVRYWLPSWQRLIFDPDPSLLQRLSEFHLRWLKAYLDQIIDAGFDGVYLDRVDAFAYWRDQRASAERDMVAFVKRISAYAKTRRPGFLIIAQNGEELLRHTDYIAAIDAVAKEDLLYGLSQRGQANTKAQIDSSVSYLAAARRAGRPVLVVEYLRDVELRSRAEARLHGLGFVPLVAPRQPYRRLVAGRLQRNPLARLVRALP